MPRAQRKTAVKRTPYRPKTAPAPMEALEEMQAPDTLLSLVKYYKEKEKARDEYVRALKEENAYLRSALASQGAVNYAELIGLSVQKVGSELHCTHRVKKEETTSHLSFVLTHADRMYTYTFQDTNIEELPDYLVKEISFDENQLHLFFFNVYECVATRE